MELNWVGYKRYAQELDSTLSQFDDDILDLDTQSDEDMNMMSKLYEECKQIIQHRLKLLSANSNIIQPKPTEVLLSHFSGMYYDYSSFRQAVQERLLNTDYPPYTKIELIMKALHGDAKKIVGCVQEQGQSELNRIWKTLEDTYFNPFLLARVGTHD